MPSFTLSEEEIAVLLKALDCIIPSPLTMRLQDLFAASLSLAASPSLLAASPSLMAVSPSSPVAALPSPVLMSPPLEGTATEGSDPEAKASKGEPGNRLPCHRNGLPLPAQPVWKEQKNAELVPSREACALLAMISTVHYDSKVHSPYQWLDSIRHTFQSSDTGHQDLQSILARCQMNSLREAGINFLSMLSYIQLAFEVER